MTLPVSVPWFQNGFHIATGLVMAVFYALGVEPRMPGRPLIKGLVYGSGGWLFNSLVVLLAIGEGIAGVRHLNAVGMIGFATANMAFLYS